MNNTIDARLVESKFVPDSLNKDGELTKAAHCRIIIEAPIDTPTQIERCKDVLDTFRSEWVKVTIEADQRRTAFAEQDRKQANEDKQPGLGITDL